MMTVQRYFSYIIREINGLPREWKWRRSYACLEIARGWLSRIEGVTTTLLQSSAEGRKSGRQPFERGGWV